MSKEKIKQLLRAIRLTSEQRTKYVSTKPLDGSNPKGSTIEGLKNHSSLLSKEQNLLVNLAETRKKPAQNEQK